METRSLYLSIQKEKEASRFFSKDEVIVSLCKDLGTLMLESICPNNDSYIAVSRERAPILGLYVKIYKFWVECAETYKKGKMDICIAYARIFYEAYMKMMYLMIKADDSLRRFVVMSYKSRYELFAKTDKESSALDIVRNMKLLDAMELDGVSIDEIKGAKGKTIHKQNFEQISSEVEEKLFSKEERRLLYVSLYALSSDVIHSDWGELRQFHLNLCEDGLMYPNIEEKSHKHYRAILPMASMVAKSIQAFITYVNEDKQIIPNGDILINMAMEIERVILLGIKNLVDEYEQNPDKFLIV